MKNTDQEKLDEIESLDWTIDFFNARISFLKEFCESQSDKLNNLDDQIFHKRKELSDLNQQLNRVPKIIKWLFRIK